MPLPKLHLPPSKSGYSAEPGSSVLMAQLDGGPSRFRLDFLGAVARVNCTWVCSPAQFLYLRAFYQSATKSGSLPFLVDLVLDSPLIGEHQATFVPGSFKLGGVQGYAHTVQAQLEAIPRPVDDAFNQSIVDLYEAYGEDGPPAAELAVFVNQTLPDDLG